MSFVQASVPVYGVVDFMTAAEWVDSANRFLDALALAGLVPVANSNEAGGYAGQTERFSSSGSSIVSASGSSEINNNYTVPLGYRVYNLATLGIFLKIDFIVIRHGSYGIMFSVRYTVGYALNGTGFIGQNFTVNGYTSADNGADIVAGISVGLDFRIASAVTVNICLTESCFWIAGQAITNGYQDPQTDTAYAAIRESINPFNFVFSKSLTAPESTAIVMSSARIGYQYGNIYGCYLAVNIANEWGMPRSWLLNPANKSYVFKGGRQYLAPLPEYGVRADSQGVLISQAYATENSQRIDYDIGFVHRGSVSEFQQIPLNLSGLGIKNYMAVKSFAPFRYVRNGTSSDEYVCLVLPME